MIASIEDLVPFQANENDANLTDLWLDMNDDNAFVEHHHQADESMGEEHGSAWYGGVGLSGDTSDMCDNPHDPSVGGSLKGRNGYV